MKLHEFAERVRQLRIQTIKDPEKGKFTLSNGTWVRVMEAELHYQIEGAIRPACVIDIYYVDTNKDTNTPEAQLIRSGLWETYECGWLIANIKGKSVMLAKVTPAEQSDLDDGWITDDGKLVLRR